jgi:hypothetical protein
MELDHLCGRAISSVDQHDPRAANPTVLWIEYSLAERGCDRCVYCITTPAQHFKTSFGGQWLRTDDHGWHASRC